ncbi:hypothetical protein [Sorangium sp. So ce128]|uniref:hypothetical protein n=1 Tax=Sorangium sp. So ce128 TaxID=3133281 RepID=UPI003F613468
MDSISSISRERWAAASSIKTAAKLSASLLLTRIFAPLWSERLPSDRPLVMAVDGNGDLVLAGTYSPGGARVLNQCLPPFSTYHTAAFVTKLDRDGNFIWSQAPIPHAGGSDIFVATFNP